MREPINPYLDLDRSGKFVAEGRHRGLIGGYWEELGRLQFEMVRNHGLRRDMKLLDLGCGCLRGGRLFVDYLDPGNYFGIDISQALLDVAFDTELAALGLQSKLPRENLLCNEDFDATSFGALFDAALAISVFTHMPLPYLSRCLVRLAPVMRPNGHFFVSIFLAPDGYPEDAPLRQSETGTTTFRKHNPYHYERADMENAVDRAAWSFEFVGDWGHPRNQKLAIYTRTANPATAS